MQTRKLGKELTVPALGLGCMGMSEFYGPGDEGDSVAAIHRVLDLGVNLLDTADTYGIGRTRSRKVMLRIPADDLDRAQLLAASKGLGYQTYIKLLLREGLDRAELVRRRA